MAPTAPSVAAQLLNARAEAADLLRRELTDTEWEVAYQPAARKLAHIIGLYGDANRERRKPYYLGCLVQEAITAAELTAYCARAQKKTASEESGLHDTDSISDAKCQL